MRRFTPFHLIMAGIILVGMYAVYMAYANWSVLRDIKGAAPGHMVSATKTKADLEVVMIYDYNCPFCNQIDPIIRDAVEADGSVNLIYKFIPAFGDKSLRMAKAVYAGGKQGKFIEVHDYFNAKPSLEYTDEQIAEMAKEVGLDEARFQADFASADAARTINDNFELAKGLGAGSTPTFLIGPVFFVPQGEMPTPQTFLDLFTKARAQQAKS